MSSYKVAIILPVYNSGKHLKPCIDAILTRTSHPFKLIIVESESTDGSNKVVDNYAINKNVEVYHTKKEGITKAQNFGIRKARDLDVYLTQDDVIIPDLYGKDWLKTLVGISKMDNCGVVTTIRGGGVSGSHYIDGFKWAGTWSLFIPRKTIKKVGLLDENFSPGPGDDIDYSFRIIKAGLKIYEANFWVDHHRMTENFNDDWFLNMRGAGVFRKKHKIFPYWEEFDLDGEKILLDSRTKDTHGCFNKGKIDDIKTIRKIKELTKDFTNKDIFIDIGANTGLMSLASKGVVMAFEPTINTFQILKNNAIINENKKITPIRHALSDRKFNYSVEEKELCGLNNIKEDNNSDLTTYLLDEINIEDDYKIKLIKIDTEGHDMRVLLGGVETIKKYKPIIIIEEVEEEFMKKKLNYKKVGVCGINTIWSHNGK